MSDLVVDDLNEEADEYLRDPLNDPREWTEHLARQLNMRETSDRGVRDTLQFLVIELDELIRTWPPQHDQATCLRFSHEATKSMDPLELYSMLLVGPPTWRRHKVTVATSLENLHRELQRILERALSAELHRLLDDWVRWDIRDLKARRKKAIAAAERPATRRSVAPEPPISSRATPQEREDMHKLRGGFFVPRGRT